MLSPPERGGWELAWAQVGNSSRSGEKLPGKEVTASLKITDTNTRLYRSQRIKET